MPLSEKIRYCSTKAYLYIEPAIERVSTQIHRLQRGDLPEMTGKAWFFCAVVAGVVMVFGPEAVGLVKNALANSLNSTSSAFNFTA